MSKKGADSALYQLLPRGRDDAGESDHRADDSAVSDDEDNDEKPLLYVRRSKEKLPPRPHAGVRVSPMETRELLRTMPKAVVRSPERGAASSSAAQSSSESEKSGLLAPPSLGGVLRADGETTVSPVDSDASSSDEEDEDEENREEQPRWKSWGSSILSGEMLGQFGPSQRLFWPVLAAVLLPVGPLMYEIVTYFKLEDDEYGTMLYLGVLPVVVVMLLLLLLEHAEYAAQTYLGVPLAYTPILHKLVPRARRLVLVPG